MDSRTPPPGGGVEMASAGAMVAAASAEEGDIPWAERKRGRRRGVRKSLPEAATQAAREHVVNRGDEGWRRLAARPQPNERTGTKALRDEQRIIDALNAL